MGVYTALLVLTFATLSASECQREQYHNGCKIQDDTCVCEWGCKNEYIYKYRRDCRNALKKKGPATSEVQNPTAYDTLSDRIDYANRMKIRVTNIHGKERVFQIPRTPSNKKNSVNTAPKKTTASPDTDRETEEHNMTCKLIFGARVDRYHNVSDENDDFGIKKEIKPTLGVGGYSRRGLSSKVGYIYPPTLPPQPRSSDICASLVCIRGICIQTNTNGYGFICKCEGTGYYGQRCEKACPTSPVRGVLFPHECVVI